MLHPEWFDVVMGQLIIDLVGLGTQKKNAKHRLEFISGNVNSYSRVMNSQQHLSLAVETNGLAAMIGEMEADAAVERAAKAASSKDIENEKERRNQACTSAMDRKKVQLQPHLAILAEGHVTGFTLIGDVKVYNLKDLLRFFFEPSLVGLSKYNRTELVIAVKERIKLYQAGRV